MAYDEKLAARVKAWAQAKPALEVKSMFGGLCFLVGGNLLGGVKDSNLLLRLGPAGDVHRGKPHILPFPTAERRMSGFLQVEPPGCATPKALSTWLDQAYAFARSLPPKATKAAAPKSSAKKPASTSPAKSKAKSARR